MREWIWVGVTHEDVAAVGLAADHPGNRWSQALPEPIREQGLSDGFRGAGGRLRPLTLCSVRQQFRQQAAHMHRLPLRAIGNLVAATGAVGHHDRIGRGAHGG